VKNQPTLLTKPRFATT